MSAIYSTLSFKAAPNETEGACQITSPHTAHSSRGQMPFSLYKPSKKEDKALTFTDKKQLFFHKLSSNYTMMYTRTQKNPLPLKVVLYKIKEAV